MGTEFRIYDKGENPKNAKHLDLIRREYCSILYESNLLGSRGPRKVRVMVPGITDEGNDIIW